MFIPTSLGRLLRATEINDLFHTSPIEDQLYDALRGGGLFAERQYLVRVYEPRAPRDSTGYMLDLALFCRDGNLAIECDGRTYHSSPAAQGHRVNIPGIDIFSIQ